MEFREKSLVSQSKHVIVKNKSDSISDLFLYFNLCVPLLLLQVKNVAQVIPRCSGG